MAEPSMDDDNDGWNDEYDGNDGHFDDNSEKYHHKMMMMKMF